MKRAAIAVLVGLALVYSVGAWLMFTAGRADSATLDPDCLTYVHRANMAGVDEEQPAGVKRAGKFGGAEIDVRLTKDGIPVAVHDSGVGRISGGAVKRRVIDMTAAEVKAVPLVHGGHPRTFRELTRVASRNGVPLVVELKPVPSGHPIRWAHAPAGVPTGLDRLAAAASAYGWGDRILWNTGRPDVFSNLRADDRFNGRLLVRRSTWGPDPSTLDGARFGSTGRDPSAAIVDTIRSHGAEPFLSTRGDDVASARALGVRVFQTHFPSRVLRACQKASTP